MRERCFLICITEKVPFRRLSSNHKGTDGKHGACFRPQIIVVSLIPFFNDNPIIPALIRLSVIKDEFYYLQVQSVIS